MNKYFLEEMTDHKWYSRENLCDNKLPSPPDIWTNDPHLALSWDNKNDAEKFRNAGFNFPNYKITEHLFPPYKEEVQNYMKPEYWKDKLPNLAEALTETEDFECDYCDGCGWYEGGKTLKTTCEKCGGTGVVKKPKAYKEEVDKDRIVEISKPQISMIPESSMREIDALVELTGQNKSAVIAGWWLRFGEVQTLKIENEWLHKLLESKEEAGMKDDEKIL